MTHWRTSFALVLAALLTACGGGKPAPASGGDTGAKPDAPSGPVRVTLALNWFPEAEHGGFYAAELKGFYREAGLEVTILPGGPDAPVVQRVATGQVDFGVANADRVVFGRAQEAPVVSVMASLQHSPRCIMVHADSDINEFSQLKQLKTLAMSAKPAFAAWLKFRGYVEGVQLVPYPGNVARFVEDGKEYGQQGYSISEPFQARQKDADPRALMVSSTGFNPYTSCLIVSEKTLEERPEVVRKLVAATIRGWEDYLSSPKSTNAHIFTKNPQMPIDVLQFGAKELIGLLDGAGGMIGRQEGDRWETLVDQLEVLKLVEKDKVDPAQCFDVSFMPEKK